MDNCRKKMMAILSGSAFWKFRISLFSLTSLILGSRECLPLSNYCKAHMGEKMEIGPYKENANCMMGDSKRRLLIHTESGGDRAGERMISSRLQWALHPFLHMSELIFFFLPFSETVQWKLLLQAIIFSPFFPFLLFLLLFTLSRFPPEYCWFFEITKLFFRHFLVEGGVDECSPSDILAH